ncbi:methylase [Spirochaetia bacterium]|nr:methylase [Spirochaetia bacterium]
MPLSWNDIKTRAAAFVSEWKDKAATAREKADDAEFMLGFLNIFGDEGRKKAIREYRVALGKNENTLFGPEPGGNQKGYIDLLWPGRILIEMKSPGEDLEKAYKQAQGYANVLSNKDFPQGILISDFVNFRYYDYTKDLGLDPELHAFTLLELKDHVTLFGNLAGYTDVKYKKIDPVNIEAAETMGKLHDRLKEIGYAGHQLELFLVRLLFCLFADDTGIFDPPDLFITYILNRTNEDGSDLAPQLQKIFEVLNKPKDKRLKTIDEQLNQFPYINGHLFEETIESADFDRPMRDTLIECCTLDWSKISPAVFGAMFQSVMNYDERHDIGAHYTSEENILKLIHPLFLDSLRDEFNKIKKLSPGIRKERLTEFHNKIAGLKFLDPACGCGNFLVISYRELRLLELEVLELLLGKEKVLDVQNEIKVNVNQFYGIEIEEFPARIAQVAMWLVDHQMNMLVSETFGTYFVRIPLTAAASIHCANSLTTDWESVVPKNELSCILGNPPFLGSAVMVKTQKAEVEQIFGGMNNWGLLDYVTAWYKKAASYIQGTEIEVAFVSTNSICQGEQVPTLWPELINKHGIKINFAHQTFKWSNEARGKAAVYCVIIGFALNDRKDKKLYHYSTVNGEPTETLVNQINAYLVEAPVIFIEKRNAPVCNVPAMTKGSSPTDDGNLMLTQEEMENLIAQDSKLKDIIRPYTGAREYLHNIPRYCIWLKDVPPSKYTHSKEIMARLARIKEFRTKSERIATHKYADFPSLFVEIRQPNTDYILIPRHSSENRQYIPIGFLDKNVIAGDATSFIPNATLYEFGIITSGMHMAWMRYVCGRLEMRYRYSNTIVYNNFPWPSSSEKQKEGIMTLAQDILDARNKFSGQSLADLYDTTAIQPELLKAHQKLDKAVEAAYGRQFDTDSQRVAYLFELYQKLSGELFIDEKKRGKGRKV